MKVFQIARNGEPDLLQASEWRVAFFDLVLAEKLRKVEKKNAAKPLTLLKTVSLFL